MKPEYMKPGPGQEFVWDYPRPPCLEDYSAPIQVIFNGLTIADTCRAKRVLETSHPPVYYIPPEDIRMEFLELSPGGSWCEWKGKAGYYSVKVRDKIAHQSAWFYSNPSPSFQTIKDHVAFYAGLMDACYVDGERVIAQPGRFYGGWITRNIVGPFKGEAGTMGW